MASQDHLSSNSQHMTGCSSREASLFSNLHWLLQNFIPSTLSGCGQDRADRGPSNQFQLSFVYFRERTAIYFCLFPPHISLLLLPYPFFRQWSIISLRHESSLLIWKYMSLITQAIQNFSQNHRNRKDLWRSLVLSLTSVCGFLHVSLRNLWGWRPFSISGDLLQCFPSSQRSFF